MNENETLKNCVVEQAKQMLELRNEIERLRRQPSAEDTLRSELLEAQSRIVSLQNVIHQLRGVSSSPNSRRVEATKRVKVLAMTGGRCFYCQEELSERSLSVDHLLPLSRGGSNRLHNLVPACFPCNNAKGDRMPIASEIELANGLRLRNIKP